ncbi:Dcp1p-Dcp2p decapping enzyme complex alpha subunit [Ceratocystis pirilliformis]|uniref:mRNA-capping enzyme subunit alpha n=1 Tax=Ceratocystis pirilliformis TaxID=259994 RepID=A0ABR3YQ55_9PEZI
MDGPIKSISEPGIKVPLKEGVQELRAEVARLLGRSQTSFPGAQPVSFTREHLRVLMMEDYYVCEKSDGIRYLLYLTTDPRGSEAHYLIDRKNDFWYNNNHSLHFPLCDDRQAFHDRTLIDGELVMDDDGDGVIVPRFLVFDCLTLGGMNLMDRTLDKRLAYFSEKVYRPYKELLTDFPEERKYLPFEVQLKDMQFAYGTEMIFNRVIPNLKHGNDGIIFTCRNTPYKHGTDPHILKWKPPEENTVDCRLRLIFPLMTPDDEDIAEGITEPYYDYDLPPKSELWKFMGDSGPKKYTYFRDVYISSEEWETLKSLGDPLDNRIVECYLDHQKRWRISRFRDDKSEGNHFTVLQSVLSSIEDGVSQKELLGAQNAIRDAWKSRQRHG